jgi:hypothetical protein
MRATQFIKGVAEGYDDPYDQGFSDGYNGNRKRNPFPLRSKEAEEYDEGWFEGLGEYEKMNPDLDEGVAEGSEYKSRHAHKQEQDKAYADYRTKHATSSMALMTRAEFAKDQRERAAKKKQGVAEGQEEKIGGRYDADEFDSMVARLKKLAGAGPMRTVYDPDRRVYRNMPTAQQPAQQPKKAPR